MVVNLIIMVMVIHGQQNSEGWEIYQTEYFLTVQAYILFQINQNSYVGESVGVLINVCVIICEQVKKSKTIAIFDYFPGLQAQLF